MLVVECKILKGLVDTDTRVFILDRLQEMGLAPLIRSTRRKAYEMSLHGIERVVQLEQFMTRIEEIENRSSPLTGDLFRLEKFVLFLIFDGAEAETAGIRAGFIAPDQMAESTAELDRFCRAISEALRDAPRPSNAEAPRRMAAEWERREPQIPAEFERAAARWGHPTRWDRPAAGEGGSWLTPTLNAILGRWGLTEQQVALGPTSNKESQVMVSAWGQSLLFVLRDTDLSILDARRMIIKLDETESSQLVVVVTGRIDDEARVYLNNPPPRRKWNGKSRDIILIDDQSTAMAELQRAFNMAALKVELSKLDGGLGLPMWALVTASFDLQERLALKKIAATAVNSLGLNF
ncbi:MAG TPA: hypothetical protein VJ302_24355 [Blastocatellia bacterium]|nr:hypothetical protein [Blastocatellia bacterium]